MLMLGAGFSLEFSLFGAVLITIYAQITVILGAAVTVHAARGFLLGLVLFKPIDLKVFRFHLGNRAGATDKNINFTLL